MAVFWIGCNQITWRNGEPHEQILAEIAQAGYEGAMAGPRGGLSAAEMVAQFAQYGLKPAPGYLGADFWDPTQEGQILERARALAAFSRDAGLTELYIGAGGFDGYRNAEGKTRRQTAACVRPEDTMTDAEFTQFARTLNAVGEITLECGARSCFHNHVGSTIETRAEIDRLFSMLDRDLVYQGPDTGHLAWAGADAVEFCRDYADSIKTIHLKDIDPNVLVQGVENGWDYGTFTANGIFAELGEGMIDFPAIFQVLQDADFEGWIVVETDVTQKPTALESATISRNYLQSIGF